jgi:membrane fusion protein, multidrug efflux system
MKTRMVLMLVAVLTLVGVLGAVKVRQVKSAVAEYANFQPPPEAVTTIVARQEQWSSTLNAIGSVEAVRGVTVSADLPGVVERITFESGMVVKEGDLLVQLDTRTERAQLSSAQAQRDLARANLERVRSLRDDKIVSQAEYDKAEADVKQAEASVGEAQASIGRKTITAPFSGVLGIRQANLGQYLSPGMPIVTLQAVNPVYVTFSVPQQQIARLRVGTEIHVSTENADVQGAGRVTAIDTVVDEGTRNIKVQATLPNPNARLRPGMFVQAAASVGSADTVVTLPASAVAYAPFGDSVFVVTDMKAPDGHAYKGVVQRFVKLGTARGDQVAVASGVRPGEEIVTSGVFKLRSGAAVRVNNTVQPSNKPAPRPDEG